MHTYFCYFSLSLSHCRIEWAKNACAHSFDVWNRSMMSAFCCTRLDLGPNSWLHYATWQFQSRSTCTRGRRRIRPIYQPASVVLTLAVATGNYRSSPISSRVLFELSEKTNPRSFQAPCGLVNCAMHGVTATSFCLQMLPPPCLRYTVKHISRNCETFRIEIFSAST